MLKLQPVIYGNTILSVGNYPDRPQALRETQLDLLLGMRREQFVTPCLIASRFALEGKSVGKLFMHLNLRISGAKGGREDVIASQIFSVSRRSFSLCWVNSSEPPQI